MPTVAVVIALLMAVAMGLALIGRAILERERATVAADALALAHASRPDLTNPIDDWYGERGVAVMIDDNERAHASSGAGRATSRAESPREVVDSPAMAAVVARARQMLDHPLSSARLEGVTVSFDVADAARFDEIAAALVVCEIDDVGERRVWELCRW